MTDQIIQLYKQCGSIKQTARELSISEGVVRKTLITAGLYSSPTSELCCQLMDDGKTVKEICKITGLSDACVQSNIPYSRCQYVGTGKTENAKRIPQWRARKEAKNEKS